MAQQRISTFTYGQCGGGLDMNPARVAAYLTNRCDICPDPMKGSLSNVCSCDILSWSAEPNAEGVVEFTPLVFESPALDPAPWYDSEIPESARFFGFLIEWMSGMDSTVSRTVTSRVSAFGGGVMGPLRAKERRMEFSVLLLGCDDNALDYGFRYLANQLGQDGCSSCETCDAEVRTSCVPIAGATPTETEWNTGLWQLKGVGLVEGPTWDESPIKGLNCHLRRAKFTLASEFPWLYKCQVTCASDEVFIPDTTDICEICEFLSGTTSICCPMNETLVIGETVPIISIFAGVDGLDDVRITVTPDAFGYSCGLASPPTGWVPETPCANIILPFLPPSSTFTLDGTTETLTVLLSTGEIVDGTPYIEPEPGTTITFPSVSCGRYCICVTVGGGATSLNGDERVNIETVHREL